MTIELLFAKANQGQTFLRMVLLGAALALGVQLAGALHRRWPWLGLAADVLCAFALALGMGQILLMSGEGLRLYGLLGLCIGSALYAAGIAPVLGWALKICPANKRPNGGTEG